MRASDKIAHTLVTSALFWLGCAEPAMEKTEPPKVAVDVDRTTPVAKLDPRFLSITIDTSRFVGPTSLDLLNAKMRRLTGALQPAYLRLGGTRADELYYDMSAAPVGDPPAPYLRLLTAARLREACEFAAALDMKMLFTLNAGPGPRDANYVWTPDNARQLIKHARAIGCPIKVWELGNEINGFLLAHGKAIKGDAYAVDMAIARTLIDEVDPAGLLAGPASAYWPVFGESVEVLPEFLAHGGRLVDVVTWHYYPQQSEKCLIASRRAEPETLLDPENLDEVAIWAELVEKHAAQHAPQAAVWLGETGHAQCGGQPGISDRFVSGLWWMDELGLIAHRGQPVVMRQSLAGSTYQLLDAATWDPQPDYWHSLLWKRLMGTKVLQTRRESAKPQTLRTYAHCSADGRSGAVSLLAINLSAEPLALALSPDLGPIREVYRVDAADILAPQVRLGGVELQAGPDGTLPELKPAIESGDVQVPGRGYVIVVLPAAAAPACL